MPHSLLVFPDEGHSLEKDPWHGYIKVREELQWLESTVARGLLSGKSQINSDEIRNP